MIYTKEELIDALSILDGKAVIEIEITSKKNVNKKIGATYPIENVEIVDPYYGYIIGYKSL